jgi:hypothetical protein
MELSANQPNATAYLEDAVSLGALDIWFRRKPGRGLETVESALRRYPLAEHEREVPHMYRRRAENF